MSQNFPLVEYENAFVEFNGDTNEAILQRMVSNPIHVYNVIRDMEHFGSEILPHVEYSILTGKSTKHGRYQHSYWSFSIYSKIKKNVFIFLKRFMFR